ncbi:VOC family protein [Rubellicoccus peritrichatus]|uniref:VOC family protein n=1 Tax=Rubellicoccus peritrichatus TaxID=3080537 RepID=A0AAQ3QTT4_9BACT|nr:VOC family protein [Puniceicoccus sp. CR14]WOO41671.1 VOC family protein [Puniceicoccus sp. CR14]
MNLNQITIPSHDVKRAVSFYERLGLRLIVDSAPRYVRFECPDGDSTFSIHHVEEEIFPGVMIYFECEDLDGEFDRLRKLGIEFDCSPTDQNWKWREAHLSDPDGNRLILFRAGVNRKNPPWRVNPIEG